jgi:hypothetical protein
VEVAVDLASGERWCGMGFGIHQKATLFVARKEDFDRLRGGRPVDPRPGRVSASLHHLGLHIGQFDEGFGGKEVAAHVLNCSHHLGFVAGLADPVGVGDEPGMLGVVQPVGAHRLTASTSTTSA